MRAVIGYQRDDVMLMVARRDSLRKWLYAGYFRPRIVIQPDMYNNVGRLCNYSKDDSGRPWQIKAQMGDQMNNGFYLIENIHTGERKIVWRELLHNVY